MKKAILLVAALLVLTGQSAQCAERNLVGNIFVDGLLGGLVGTMLGGAGIALTEHPGDHLDYLRYGAAIGVIGGSVFGIVDYSIDRSLAEIEDGKVKVAFPTIMLDPAANSAKGEVRVVANLVKGRF